MSIVISGDSPNFTSATLTTPVVTTTIGVGGATPAASGAGISFPATQSASTDANTLDDYEEGTWTPSVGGNATYNAQYGYYVKVGTSCTVHFRLAISVRGTGSTTTLSGLPFTSAAFPNLDVYTGKVSYFNALATNVVYISMYANQGNTTCRFPIMTSATSGTNDGAAVFADSTTIYGSVTYFTAN